MKYHYFRDVNVNADGTWEEVAIGHASYNPWFSIAQQSIVGISSTQMLWISLGVVIVTCTTKVNVLWLA